ncbi:hypothetical protein ACF1AE_21670 [Streptomyces sp. NPDC014986]|uniref:hypothetical protein n=1 Tax=Streptomyces sp. NPDC014986 TaxID=3364934 RepID=UPI003701739C
MNTLTAMGVGLVACGIAALLTGRLVRHRAVGLVALGEFFGAADCAAADNPSGSAILAAIGLACTWLWWKGGGDDDAKRRRRRLRRMFNPVRRTAPAPS